MAKTKSNFKRKIRSDNFPLTLHPTGQYCKKIKGKIYYFGKDKKQALERYLNQAPFLHNGKAKMSKTTNGNMALKICVMFTYSISKLKLHLMKLLSGITPIKSAVKKNHEFYRPTS